MARLSVNILSAFEVVVFIIMFVVYPLLSWWTLYKKDDYRSLVAEFKFVKKVATTTFFILVALSIVQAVNHIINPLGVSNPDWTSQLERCSEFLDPVSPALRFICPGALLTSVSRESIIFYSISGFATLVFYSGLLKIISLVFRNVFTFYLAKGYVNTAPKRTRCVEKMRYLGLCLKSYDLYLRKRLDLSIKNVSQIFGKMFVINKQLKNEKIESFRSSFENEKLGPLSYLVSIASKEDTDEILTGEIVKSFSEILKEYGIWLATVIPVIILVLQFILNPVK